MAPTARSAELGGAARAVLRVRLPALADAAGSSPTATTAPSGDPVRRRRQPPAQADAASSGPRPTTSERPVWPWLLGGRGRAGLRRGAGPFAPPAVRARVARGRPRWLPCRHAAPAAYLSRRARLDPPPRRARASSTSTSAADALPRRGRERVRDLVIPPGVAATCGSARGRTGTCRRSAPTTPGRRQYLYHPRVAHPARRREVRRGCCEFGRVLSQGARAGAASTSAREGMSQERACAVAVRLLDLGYFRIGNDVYADENGSFGLTTLRAPARAAAPAGRWSSRSSASPAIEHEHHDRRRRGRSRRSRSCGGAAAADERAAGLQGGPVAGATSTAGPRQRLRPVVRRASRRPRRTSAPGTRPCSPPRRCAETDRAGRDQGLAQAGECRRR